ncbi:MAG: putative bifunctional diguanylate cyclase/phosphodiesterase [Actinomycetota bacterium]
MNGTTTLKADESGFGKTEQSAPAEPGRARSTSYHFGVAFLTIVPLALYAITNPERFAHPNLLIWAVAIAVVDLLPIQMSSDLSFSLSFPLELAVAMIYAPPVAAAVAFLGTTDIREFRRDISLDKVLFVRAQIALSVAAQAVIFHGLASFNAHWYQLGAAVLLATAVGYSINVLLVAFSVQLDSGDGLWAVIADMHRGIVGEFLVSYTGLALFGVVIALFWVSQGIWSIVVFVAPMAFARQMFARTQSLNEATKELEKREREKTHQALHDSLTGLPNRVLFLEKLNSAVDRARANRREVAVMILDLDRFKDINDTLGHHYGDRLLQQVGPRLQGLLRDGDTIARLGGDEFGIILPDLPNRGVAVSVVKRLLEHLEEPLAVEGFTLDVSASIGMALFPQHSQEVETLLRRADVAMYVAKEAQSGCEIYDAEKDKYSPARLAMLAEIRPAIESGQFLVHYQPKVDLRDGSVRGVEALLRWMHPTRGLLAPDEFIPVVERTVLLSPLTYHVLDVALRQCSEWRRAGLDLTVAVNLSPRNLVDLDLPERVIQLLNRWRVPASSLIIEITEGTLMADPARCTDVLARLSAAGVELSIDDFGTGYSSLGNLKKLPVDEIKVDRSFVMNMGADPNDRMIVRATVELSHNLGLRVVAEGVETREALRELQFLDCDQAQGFYLSRPMSASDFRVWMDEYRRGRTSNGSVSRVEAGTTPKAGLDGTHLNFSRRPRPDFVLGQVEGGSAGTDS